MFAHLAAPVLARRGAIPLIRPGMLTGRVAYTRTGPATGTTAAGLVYPVAADVPRYNAAGEAWAENQRTNAGLYSEQIDNAAWTKYSIGTGVAPVVAANAAVAPDGATTADQITVNRSSATGASAVYQSFSSAASTYPVALWLRAATGGDVGQALSITQWNGAALINATTYTLTASWVRVLLPNATALTAGAARHFLRIGYEQSVGAGTGQIQFLMWGVMPEAAPYSGTYIPTAASAVTRGADTYAVSLLRPSAAGAMLLALRPQQAAPTGVDQIAAQIGTDTDRLMLRCVAGGNTLRLSREASGGGLVDAVGDLGTQTPGTMARLALTWDGAGNAWAKLAGGTWRTVAGVPMALTGARLANRVDGARAWGGTIAWVDEIPTLISEGQADAYLAALPAV